VIGVAVAEAYVGLLGYAFVVLDLQSMLFYGASVGWLAGKNAARLWRGPVYCWDLRGAWLAGARVFMPTGDFVLWI